MPQILPAACCAIPVALVLALEGGPPASDITPQLHAFLSGDLGFPPSEEADLTAGKIVRHSLDVTAAGEIAVAGAVRVAATKAAFTAKYRDIVSFKRGPEVLQIGRFSDPPTLTDLDELTIDTHDMNLRNCRVRDCDVRLPAEAIARVQREIDWTASDADSRAAALFKQILLNNVRAYAAGGPGRITEYDDDKRVVRPIDEFAGILKMSPYVATLVPGLGEHLREFPTRRLSVAEDFLYWSKEKFGIAPFITVTHVTMTRDLAGDEVIASRDVYSSRYFDASLALAVASESLGSPGRFYLVYVNRSRANALKGPFAGLRRSLVERRARSSIEENLKSVKLRVERVADSTP